MTVNWFLFRLIVAYFRLIWNILGLFWLFSTYFELMFYIFIVVLISTLKIYPKWKPGFSLRIMVLIKYNWVYCWFREIILSYMSLHLTKIFFQSSPAVMITYSYVCRNFWWKIPQTNCTQYKEKSFLRGYVT